MTKHEQLATSLIKYGKTKSWEDYGKEFGLSSEAARAVWKRVRFDGYMKDVKTIVDQANKSIEQAVTNRISNDTIRQNYIADLESVVISQNEDLKAGTATKTVQVSEEVKSLEDLIRVCKIDTTIWDITRYSQKSTYGDKFTVEAFMSRKEESIVKESLLEDIKKYHEERRLEKQVIEPKILDFNVQNIAKPKRTQLLELAVFDLHLGKLSWKGETGEDYDIQIAIERYKTCIRELLSRVDLSKIDRILLPLGNDMIHIDNKFKTTTNGTPQDTDSRFAKIIKVARNLLVETIEELSVIAPVDVIIVPGNHDQTVMFTLGEILDAYFYGSEDVIVYNDPRLRKYYKYGQNMIMFTHGSEEKHAELGLIAATEAPQIWASTKYREVHLGHLHKSKSVKYTNVDEYQGFKIRIINSLSGTDAWHYSKGYMALKGAEAFVWDREKGLITNHFYNL